MGRPTKFNRDDAIEIAMNVFWAKGYEPTSVSDLASAMSITRSSFYNSFLNRDAMFAEALARYESDDIDLPLTSDLPGMPAGDTLHIFFNSICEKLAADPMARGCMIINCLVQSSEDKPAPRRVRAFTDRKRTQFITRIEQAKAEGAIDPATDTKILATSLLTFLVGINIIGKTIRDVGTLKATARQFLENSGFPSPLE